jgi:hypothetical protein
MKGMPFRLRLCFFVGAGLVVGGIGELAQNPADPISIPAIALGIALWVLGFILTRRSEEPPQ